MNDIHTQNKTLIASMRAAMYDFETESVQATLNALIEPNAVIHMPWPLGDMIGPEAL